MSLVLDNQTGSGWKKLPMPKRPNAASASRACSSRKGTIWKSLSSRRKRRIRASADNHAGFKHGHGGDEQLFRFLNSLCVIRRVLGLKDRDQGGAIHHNHRALSSDIRNCPPGDTKNCPPLVI